MIRFECPNCGSKLNAKDEKAGQTAPCPKCKTPVQIEEVVEAVAIEPTVAPPKPQTEPSTFDKFRNNKQVKTVGFPLALVASGLTCCFPLTVIVAALHPTWTTVQKLVWGLVAMIPCFFLVILASIAPPPSSSSSSRPSFSDSPAIQQAEKTDEEKLMEYDWYWEEMRRENSRRTYERSLKEFNDKVGKERRDRLERTGELDRMREDWRALNK